MPILIVVDNPETWPFDVPNVDVIAARRYLTDPDFARHGNRRVYNLCKSYRYQSLGYYASLLAEARGHRPIPSLLTVQDLRSQAVLRHASEELDDTIQRSLKGLQSDAFTLSIYFARNLAKRYDALCKHLYNRFPAPFLRAEFVRQGARWEMRSLSALPANDIPEEHRSSVVTLAQDFFEGKTQRPPKRARSRYSLAILVDPDEKTPPSNAKALQRFERAAESLGFSVELIEREDIGRLSEFDALFLRTTTNVNHYTYRFAQRATSEGLVVIDSPESILKCSNKVFTAELLERFKIPTPRTLIIHKENMREAPAKIGLPLILKQPDSAFSLGVTKVDSEADYLRQVEELLKSSELVIAQAFMPTAFDWRIGVLEGKPLYACKYFMARRHWQIYNRKDGKEDAGMADAVPVDMVPRQIIRTAVKAADLMGDGLYGVDIKEVDGKPYVIEVNDNPSIDGGLEDAIARESIYDRIAEFFLRRVESAKRTWRTHA